jgi:aspartate/methionine/tyrosine aminotransferase
MQIKDFVLERYFAKYEFKAKYLLSSSDCDGFPMQYILNQATEKELFTWNNLKLGYTETRGSEDLRTSISNQYQKINTDRIVVGSPGELNFAFMNVLLSRGDEVISMAPMYQSMYQLPKSIGCKLRFWKPDMQQKKWYYDPAKLEKLITPKTKLIVVNFPHNPTGFTPSKDDLNAIIAIARKHGITIFSDEMYHLMTHNRAVQTLSVADLYENGVALWGMAKTFGMGGLRIGWLASQNNDLLTKVESYKDYLSICNSATSEVLASITLNHKEAFIEPNLQKISKNIEIFKGFCRRNPHFVQFPMPNAGSTAFVKLKIKESSMDFAEKLVEETSIMLLPAETFEYGAKHVRIGFGRESFGEVLGKLEEYIGKK